MMGGRERRKDAGLPDLAGPAMPPNPGWPGL